MKISRHYLNVDGRTVHYRRCGEGPPLLMVHQSPRSSAEYIELMRKWGEHFTCIAPDTPGFGQSDPLANPDPAIDDYADAITEFIHALGIDRVAAYGFHSGGIILVTALKRHPQMFRALAVGGYAVWTAQEMAIFGERYLPPFRPTAYGEHLVWLWNRILEQSWFFPWFDVRDETRLANSHDEPASVDAIVMEMLASGDAYRLGYGAVLRAPRDIPPVGAITPPVMITAYDGDPLQAHIDRLGAMPAGWTAAKVATPEEHQQRSLEFLLEHQGPAIESTPADDDRGFLHLRAAGFDGLIHWRRSGQSTALYLHAPGRALELLAPEGGIAIDLPGHGLSDDWPEAAPEDWSAWQAVIDTCAERLGAVELRYEPLPVGDPDRLYPDLSPDRHGAYLTRAWSIVRAGRFFDPWYSPRPENAKRFDAEAVLPEGLAIEHRARLRARSALAYHRARSAADDRAMMEAQAG